MIKQTFFQTLDALNEWYGPNGSELVEIISIYFCTVERVHFIYYRDKFDESYFYNENMKLLDKCTKNGCTDEARLILNTYGASKLVDLRGNIRDLRDLHTKLNKFLND